MSDEREELGRRLVIGHKSDGRKVFDERVKAEVVALATRKGTSVSRLARQLDINANQLSRWIREQRRAGERRTVLEAVVPSQPAFMPVEIQAPAPTTTCATLSIQVRMAAQAKTLQSWHGRSVFRPAMPDGTTLSAFLSEVAEACAGKDVLIGVTAQEGLAFFGLDATDATALAARIDSESGPGSYERYASLHPGDSPRQVAAQITTDEGFAARLRVVQQSLRRLCAAKTRTDRR